MCAHSSTQTEKQHQRETILQDVFDWLLDARYWLGFLVGRSSKLMNGYLDCDELEFHWYSYNGVRVNIRARSDRHSSYSDLFYDSSFMRLQDFFEYRLPRDIYPDEYFEEIEQSIKKFFPRIRCANTWALCEANEVCREDFGFKTICYEIDGKKICHRCKEHRESLEINKFPGYVYLIGNSEQHIYKIGLSKQPKSRFKAFKTKLPFEIKILHQINADEMNLAERALHKHFQSQHTHGEWFSLSDDDVALICGIVTFERGKFLNELGQPVSIEVDFNCFPR